MSKQDNTLPMPGIYAVTAPIRELGGWPITDYIAIRDPSTPAPYMLLRVLNRHDIEVAMASGSLIRLPQQPRPRQWRRVERASGGGPPPLRTDDLPEL